MQSFPSIFLHSEAVGQILVVDELYREPALDGGSRAISDLLRTLRELGYTADIARSFAEVQTLADDAPQWTAAFLSRPELSLRCIDLVRQYAERVIFVGLDLHYRRLAGEAEHGTGSEALSRAHLAMERQCWSRCDVSIYPDRSEVATVAELVGTRRAQWFPYFRVDETAIPRRRASNASFVMLGGAGHSPNTTGLRWFIESVAPLLAKQPPVDVIGWWPDDRRPHSPAVDFNYIGTTSQEELLTRLANARGMLVPLRTGAGLKSKVIDALSTATPLITTSIGMQGIEDPSTVALVSDDPNDWPGLLQRVTTDDDETIDRCAVGVDYVNRVHGAIPFQRCVQELITAR
jgi:glycosyltransferase involved in cell wall biosynthesis